MARPRARPSATGKEELLKGLWQREGWIRVSATGGSATGTRCTRGPPASPQLQTQQEARPVMPLVAQTRPWCPQVASHMCWVPEHTLRSGLMVCGSSRGRGAASQGGGPPGRRTSGGGPCSAGPAEVGRRVCRAGPHAPRGRRPPPCQHRTPHHAHAHEGFVGYFSKSCAEAVARLSAQTELCPQIDISAHR